MKRRVAILAWAAPLALRGLPGACALLLLATALRAQELTAAERESLRTVLARWLDAQGLASLFELQRLDWVAGADETVAARLQLELLFRGPAGESQDAASERFDEAINPAGAAAGVDLVPALFYKLVQAAGVPRARAAVVFRVQGQSYWVTLDVGQGRPVMRGDTGRTRVARVGADLPVYGQGPVPTVRGRVPLAAAGDALPERIQGILETYFRQGAARAGAPAPALRRKPLERTYVAIEAEGLYRLVLPEKKYWERLSVSIELHRDSEDRTRAACYLDGRYTTGLGNRPPPAASYVDDMDLRHHKELEDFANELLRKLQEELKRGGP